MPASTASCILHVLHRHCLNSQPSPCIIRRFQHPHHGSRMDRSLAQTSHLARPTLVPRPKGTPTRPSHAIKLALSQEVTRRPASAVSPSMDQWPHLWTTILRPLPLI